MNKIVLIPDSFKGTMDSQRICDIMKTAILKFFPEAQVASIPVADGGEGSVDAFLAASGGEKIYMDVKGPHFEDVHAYYGIIDGDVAVIEMAAAAGLPLAPEQKRPEEATTYGVGQMILDAARRKCRRIVVGLGGSATNDAGAGAACAIGIRFLDKDGKAFIPTGGTLKDVVKIDMTGRNSALEGMEITAMCDIDNPLYGKNGAAYIFGPQKGADGKKVEFLDDQLRGFSGTILRELGMDVSSLPGGGAAGGLGAGMSAFFGAKLQMGIETILDVAKFDEIASDADMILTGEGKIDSQSVRGKVVSGVAKRAEQCTKALVVAIVGDIGPDIEVLYEQGLDAVFSINRLARDFPAVKKDSPENLLLTVENLMRFVLRLKKKGI